MERMKFNPKDWFGGEAEENDSGKVDKVTKVSKVINDGVEKDIEEVTKRIEAASVDITGGYAEWRDLGFALTDALGEAGRQYYHRISRFYREYSFNETEVQYNRCLNAKGHGVTIATFFHRAKEAGVPLRVSEVSRVSKVSEGDGEIVDFDNSEDSEISSADEIVELMPTFSQDVEGLLPQMLRNVMAVATSAEDADMLVLGAITALSACLPNVYGNYARREVFPNLFLFITAQASSGKGRLTLCRHLVMPVHNYLKKQYHSSMEEYKNLLNEYVLDRKNNQQPTEPPLKTLLIPANSSATSVYQVLNDNGGVGLMFETEGDTLANTFKSDYGNFSDGFRKAFHHEMISYTRRKDREFVELSKPKLSALLSGTPKQVLALIPDAENGLFSRFIFYWMNTRLEWNDVFAESDKPLDGYFQQLGFGFYELYKILEKSNPKRFTYTELQQKQFNDFFEVVQVEYSKLFGLDIVASVRRLGLITFRIGMILSSLRMVDNGCFPDTIECDDDDFKVSIIMAKVLLEHTAKVFGSLPLTDCEALSNGLTNIKQTFLDNLPQSFSRRDYLAVAERLKVTSKTAERYISKFCSTGRLKHSAHDSYEKS